MNKEKLFRYILMKREKEMGVSLDEEQLNFFNEMENIINSDSVVKNQIDILLNTTSMQQMNRTLKKGYIEQSNNIVELKEEVDDIVTEPEGGASIAPASTEMGTQLTLKPNTSRKAGFVDGLVMALVTGFVGGVATTILFILI